LDENALLTFMFILCNFRYYCAFKCLDHDANIQHRNISFQLLRKLVCLLKLTEKFFVFFKAEPRNLLKSLQRFSRLPGLLGGLAMHLPKNFPSVDLWGLGIWLFKTPWPFFKNSRSGSHCL